jgi:hypothetical protein
MEMRSHICVLFFLHLTYDTLVLFGSKNVTQMVMVMVYVRLLAVTNLNRLVLNFSVVFDLRLD